MAARAEAEEKKKKKGIGTWIYRIVILILLGVMAFSAYNLWLIYQKYHEGTVLYDDFADEFGAGKNQGTDNSRLHLDWPALQEKYPEVKAWIRSRGTKINYPIVQGTDNSYYLTHAPTKEYTEKGSIFIDYEVANPFEDFNTIIYGHRMKDGSMFFSLTNYFGEEGIDFYAEHPTMELYTPDHDYDIEIFACATVHENDVEAYRADFHFVGEDLEDENLKAEYIAKILGMNELQAKTDVVVLPNDKIVMLSTCTALGSSRDPHREVVWGKLVPPKD